MHDNATRCEIDLDILERRPDLSDRDALELLRSEFRLAVNASHFIALSADDPQIVAASRAVGLDAIARYELTLEFVARRELEQVDAIALVRREFQRALNASYFSRVCVEDLAVTVRAGELVDDESLRWAA
jgi:hypothetical protein